MYFPDMEALDAFLAEVEPLGGYELHVVLGKRRTWRNEGPRRRGKRKEGVLPVGTGGDLIREAAAKSCSSGRRRA